MALSVSHARFWGASRGTRVARGKYLRLRAHRNKWKVTADA
jgi:hypothetical protein